MKMGSYEFIKVFKKISTSLKSTKHSATADKTPLLYCEPGVLSGYRVQHKPIKFYIKSLLQIHNETINIWTHLIACCLVMMKTYNCLKSLEDSDYFAVILCFGMCCVLYTAISTVAHTVHSKSPMYHYTCFQVDYMGIGYYAFGSSILLYYTGCHEKYYVTLQNVLLPAVVVMSWVGFICCCIAKLRYRRPYPFQRKLWNLCSFGFQCTSVFSVVLARYYDCFIDNKCTLSSLNHHTTVAIYILSSVVFFSSHIPEKYFPGKFDIFGQGHQIFHVLCSFGTLEQFNAAMIDIKTHTPLLTNHRPRLGSILTAMLVYTILVLLTLKCLRHYTKNRIKSDTEFEKSRMK